MRIELIAPPWVAVPPPAYGGTEVVIDNLARGLRERGHDVRLFTVGESTCPVPRDYLYPMAVGTADGSVEEAAHVLAAYDEIDAINDIDLIHDHTVLGPLLAAPLAQPHPPIVTTVHSEFSAENRRIFAKIATGARIVAISHAQAATAAEVPITAVIHHGIDLDVYQPGDGDGGYLLFLGRMSPSKGVHLAVRMARQTGQRLILAAKMREPAEWTYYEQCVRPLLGGDDDLWIEPTLSQRLDMLRGATALLNPITWPEPFGLAMVEALATGTPVLTFASGAAPEIVDHGITGYVCHTEHDMIEAIDRIHDIDRTACRTAAEQRFSMQRMARDYERLYRSVLDDPPINGTDPDQPLQVATSSNRC